MKKNRFPLIFPHTPPAIAVYGKDFRYRMPLSVSVVLFLQLHYRVAVLFGRHPHAVLEQFVEGGHGAEAYFCSDGFECCRVRGVAQQTDGVIHPVLVDVLGEVQSGLFVDGL